MEQERLHRAAEATGNQGHADVVLWVVHHRAFVAVTALGKFDVELSHTIRLAIANVKLISQPENDVVPGDVNRFPTDGGVPLGLQLPPLACSSSGRAKTSTRFSSPFSWISRLRWVSWTTGWNS